jgi:hypothetical protein
MKRCQLLCLRFFDDSVARLWESMVGWGDRVT